MLNNRMMIEIEKGIFTKPLGYASPRILCLSVKENYVPSPSMKLVWSINAGQGSEGISDTFAEGEKEAAEELIKEGKIVPTFSRQVQLGTTVRSIDHFAHVNWARDTNGNVLILDLLEDDDRVITTGETHEHAVNLLEDKLRKGTAWETTPIIVKGDREVTPITTDQQAHQRDLRARSLG